MHTTTSNKPPRAPAPLLVSVKLRPLWAYIDGVREFGRFFCDRTFTQPGVAERARLVLQETLENAVKYASPSEDNRLELEIASDGSELQISTLSQADPKHLRALREEIDMQRRFNPEAAFLAAFARAAYEPDAPSGLGFARMRFESRFDVQISEEGGGNVRVTAIGAL